MAKSKKEGVGHVQDSPNDPVFVPNFEDIESLKKKMTQESLTPDRLEYGDIRETICGTTDDSQPVEQYDGSLGVTRAFVDTHQAPVGVLRWHTNLASIYTDHDAERNAGISNPSYTSIENGITCGNGQNMAGRIGTCTN